MLARFKASSTPWSLPEALTPEAIESLIFPEKKASVLAPVLPDWLHIDTEMRRPGGRGNFCGRNTGLKPENGYWGTPNSAAATGAGRKTSAAPCDRSTVPVVNPDTGEVRRAAIFVAVMGASNYSYVEACEGQDMSRCLMFPGGVPQLLIPDNLRSAVKKADRYEPVLNECYQALAEHYGTVILPARPRKPKDKPKAENGVLIVERWLLARIRNETFHTLRGLNNRLRELLADLNNRPIKGYGNQTRAERFALLDVPAL